jgi:hypothetical protein
MTSRKWQCLAALLAVTIAAGIATANAAAAEGPVWLVNGVQLLAGESINALGKGTLTFVVPGIELEIRCSSLVEKTVLKGGEPGTDEDKLTYLECSAIKPAGCKTTTEITIEANTTLLFVIRVAGKLKVVNQAEWGLAAEKGFGDRFVGKELGSFGKVSITGCADEGTFSLTGNYVGVVNSGLEFLSELDELKFGTSAGVATGLLLYEGEEGQALEVAV